MDDTIKSILTGLIRYGLIGVFGNLVAKGYVTENNLLLAAGLIAGALLIVGSMVIRKIKVKYRLESASDLPSNATPEEIKALAREKMSAELPVTKFIS